MRYRLLILLLTLLLALPAAGAELRGRVLEISDEYGFAFLDLGAATGVRPGDVFTVLAPNESVAARVRVTKVYADLCEGDLLDRAQPQLLRVGLVVVRVGSAAPVPATPATPVTPVSPVTPATPATPLRPPAAMPPANFVAALVRTIAQPGIIEHPLAVTVGTDRKIYFVDTRHHSIMLWQDASNNAVALPTATVANLPGGVYFGRAPGQFAFPSGLASDTGGLIYVVDSMNNRVQVVDRTGKVRRVIGELGTANGRFLKPAGIAVNPPTGTMFVADAGNDRVQQFSAAGVYVKTLAPADGFRRPAGLVFTDRHLFVVDGGKARIVVFDIDGKPAATFGEGMLTAPRGICVDNRGLLYVADPGAGCVFIYSLGGVLQGCISGPELNRPFSVAWHPDGQLVVADPETNALLLYRVTRVGGAAAPAPPARPR